MVSQGYSFIYTGEVTITDSLIDGWLAFDYELSEATAGANIDYSVKIDYNQVGLDGAGCPSSGSLTAAVDVDVSGLEGLPAGAGNAYDYPDVDVEFGPACGDATMY